MRPHLDDDVSSVPCELTGDVSDVRDCRVGFSPRKRIGHAVDVEHGACDVRLVPYYSTVCMYTTACIQYIAYTYQYLTYQLNVSAV